MHTNVQFQATFEGIGRAVDFVGFQEFAGFVSQLGRDDQEAGLHVQHIAAVGFDFLHFGDNGGEVFAGQRGFFRHMHQLPQTETGITTAARAIQIFVFHEHTVGFGRVEFGFELCFGAVLENQRLQGFGVVNDVECRCVVVCTGSQVGMTAFSTTLISVAEGAVVELQAVMAKAVNTTAACFLAVLSKRIFDFLFVLRF